LLFNSYEYLLAFLPVTTVVYLALGQFDRGTASKVWLVFASLVFYSWWGLHYLPLIVTSILINYAIGTSLGRDYYSSGMRRTLLFAGLAFNLGLLGYFKYANFFVDNLNNAAGINIHLAHIALPLAISFFTFQKIAYLVDSFRGETVGYNFLDYALFVTFFPQLIAGPIVHHKDVVPQFRDRSNAGPNPNNLAIGLSILGIGLFKKVMIADTFAPIAAHGFDAAGPITCLDAWLAGISYTFQLYFDFSGYTDMAIGAAFLFNIRLPINFNSPYQATDIQDFWRRWHITLSRFLRDYVYIPLGGNRGGEPSTYANLFATFLIGGLWHGASWMFVIWGALHGAAVVVHRAWSKTGRSMPRPLSWCLTFTFVSFTWIFFRATDMASAQRLIVALGNVRDGSLGRLLTVQNRPATILILIAFAIISLSKTTVAFCTDERLSERASAMSGMAFVVSLMAMSFVSTNASQFLLQLLGTARAPNRNFHQIGCRRRDPDPAHLDCIHRQVRASRALVGRCLLCQRAARR
jgi:D-alanyl-lipoteichoic acid acyltransferase DltB (MBOAT superfamily)